MAEARTISEADTAGSLQIIFSGGMADDGALLFSEYSESLDGWRRFFELTGRLYLRSLPELKQVSPHDLLRIQITTERRGSFETWLSFAIVAAVGGIIGNRADAALVWSYKRLLKWYQRVIQSHITTRSVTTNIEDIVASLEQLATANDVDLEPVDEQSPQLLLDTISHDVPEQEDPLPPVSKARTVAEVIDQSLQAATRPLDSSCWSIALVPPDEPPLFVFGAKERAILTQPLTLPPPKRDWVEAVVRFERINRKTGRALVYFDRPTPQGPFYSRIIDAEVHEAGNVFTEAFNLDMPLRVWVRQRAGERGRLNLLWEITAKDPDEGKLFGDL